MKKLLIIGAIAIGTLASAFPFRTSCGMVFQINDNYAANSTPEALNNTLMGLNMNACGVRPAKIVYYIS